MRVLHITPTYVPAWRYGGPIRSVHGLCSALARRGVDVHVFTTNVDGPDDLDVPIGVPREIDGVKVWYFRSRWLRRLFYAPAMADELRVEAAKFDLLHMHSTFLWPTWMAARQARAQGIPYVVSPRGMLVPELIRKRGRLRKTAWIRLIEHANLAHAAAVHFTSTRELKEAEQLGLAFRTTCVVPNGVEDEELLALEEMAASTRRDAGAGEPFLLYVGRISWEKGLDRMIAALARVPGCRLVLAGGGEANYRAELVALAQSHAVAERLQFLGEVGTARRRELMREAAILVLPSYSENFGNVVLEGMASGCPVIVTPEVGAAEIVEASGSGFILPGDPDMLGPGIAKVLADPARLEEAGRRGRDAIARSYTWSSVAARMELVYRNVLGRN